MRILDESGRVLTDPDLEVGKMVEERRPIVHRYEVTQHEQGHYETVREYPNGGRDIEWVVDVPEEGRWVAYGEDGEEVETETAIPDDAPHEIDIPGADAFLRYVPLTADELAERAAMRVEAEIGEYRRRLADTDYIAMKIAEGSATRDEYADVIAQRREWRDRINELRG